MKNTYGFGKYAAGIFLSMIFLSLLSVNIVHAQYYVSLEPATTSGNHNLIVGTAAAPVANVYGMTATFSGDFSDNVVSNISINWTGSWLLAGGGTGAHSWIVNDEEDGATLTFWRTDEQTVSGYGKVMELVGTGQVGELIIDDVGKTGAGLSIASVSLLQKAPKLQAWPIPASQAVSMNFAQESQAIKILNSAGKEMPVKLSGNTLDISAFAPGIYFVQEITLNGVRNGRIMVSDSGK